jgi:DNA-binding protein H-NS
MTDFLNIAKNKNRLRAACKELTTEQLETMAENITEFIEKRIHDAAKIAEQTAKKEAEKRAILEAIAEAGLTAEELFNTSKNKAANKTRKPVAPQYRITDANGKQHEWTGRGRTPKVFEQYFNNGGNKESCRIKS